MRCTSGASYGEPQFLSVGDMREGSYSSLSSVEHHSATRRENGCRCPMFDTSHVIDEGLNIEEFWPRAVVGDVRFDTSYVIDEGLNIGELYSRASCGWRCLVINEALNL